MKSKHSLILILFYSLCTAAISYKNEYLSQQSALELTHFRSTFNYSRIQLGYLQQSLKNSIAISWDSIESQQEKFIPSEKINITYGRHFTPLVTTTKLDFVFQDHGFLVTKSELLLYSHPLFLYNERLSFSINTGLNSVVPWFNNKVLKRIIIFTPLKASLFINDYFLTIETNINISNTDIDCLSFNLGKPSLALNLKLQDLHRVSEIKQIGISFSNNDWALEQIYLFSGFEQGSSKMILKRQL